MLKFIESTGIAYWSDMPETMVWGYPANINEDAEGVALLKRRCLEVQLFGDNMRSPQGVGVIRETADNKWHVIINWASNCATTADTLEEAILHAKVVFAMEDLYAKYAGMTDDVPF